MTDPLTSQPSQVSRGYPQTSIERAGPGTVVGGRYTLRAAIGHGGMGTVWRATDTQLNRLVAVKEVVTPPGIAPEDRDAMYERMLREARAAAVLSHPGVVQVYDVVTDGDRPWIVMELLDARSLSDMVLEDGPLAPRAVAKIGMTLLGALEVAHAAGVLHRDVKPANVLVCTDGRCVLTDFGVARMPTDQQLTTPGMVLGSPHFISPERAMGASFGPPSDLFSLGVTLYCAVEGQPPFDKGDPIATMHSVVEDEPRPPQRAGVLTEVLYGLLEKNPDRRWDAPRARAALRELLAGPLASRTPQFPTDPYSVVPAQPPAWSPASPAGGSKVGGRALLAPGESPADRADARRAPADTHRPPHHSAYEATGAYQQTGAYHDAYQQASDPYQRTPDPYRGAPDPYRGGFDDAGTAALPPVAVGQPPSPGRRPAGAGQQLSEMAQRAGAKLRDAGGRLREAARRDPRRATMFAAGGGVALVLLVVVAWLVSGRGGDPVEPPSAGDAPDPTVAAPADQPLLPVQQVSYREIQVNVPEGWEEADSTSIRVDYVDPQDSIARIRLLVEDSGRPAHEFVTDIAEPTIAGNCAGPYQRVDLTDIELDGHPATLLEYTCGEGQDAYRTRWVTTVRDGKAYSFFVRLPADRVDDQTVIFDEMVRSFHLAEG